MSVQQEKFTEIADAIRAKTGETDLIKPSEFASKVDDVYDAGKVEGAKAEYDAFWDTFQSKGAVKRYECSFAGWGWTNSNFKPKYDIKPSVAYMMFRYSQITDLVGCLNKSGVKLDFSNCTNMQLAFHGPFFPVIPTIDIRKATNLNQMFYSSEIIKTIEKIIIKDDGTTPFTSDSFYALSKLVNIRFEGVIGRSISFAQSPLSVDSMVDIINHLANYVGTDKANKYTLTFTSACWTALEATTPPEGYTTWKDYVGNGLGWKY